MWYEHWTGMYTQRFLSHEMIALWINKTSNSIKNFSMHHPHCKSTFKAGVPLLHQVVLVTVIKLFCFISTS